MDKNIEFLSTAFDFDSIEFAKSLGMKRWKIPSGEITNLPYLIKIAKLNKPIILSTGMSTMDDIEKALSVLRENGAGEITVLHCTTEYPTPFSDVNLKAMLSIKEEFGVKVGYSDHTQGIEVAIAATALGATVIEKHLTLDRKMEGPDHKASLEPAELKQMVEQIRHIEAGLGNGIKRPNKSEAENAKVVQKSILAKRPIKQGEMLTEDMLVAKRAGEGISAKYWDMVVGANAIKDFEIDEPIVLW